MLTLIGIEKLLLKLSEQKILLALCHWLCLSLYFSHVSAFIWITWPDASSFFSFKSSSSCCSPFPKEGGEKKSEGNYSSLKEKLITRRSELSFLFTYTPRTRAEFKALAKEFSNPSQDTLEFAKEFRLTIWSYESGFSDPYQSIQLLASKSKAREWLKEAGWKRPLMNFESHSPEAHTKGKELA